MNYLDTDALASKYRSKSIRMDERKILVTLLAGTEQEKDLSLPANCEGLGRIHHFRKQPGGDWPDNRLPIGPAYAALGQEASDMIKAQVFQNAACNWRCWYCFVDFKLLNADPKHSRWVTAEELVRLYAEQESPPQMIDLSGGQPDLVPEWVPWMMRALRDEGLEGKVYLWSDDNLSGDYFWRYLTDADRELVATFRGYGRVGCFKGFNPSSFSYNTRAAPELFERQFELFERLVRLGLDVYAYVTFTTPEASGMEDDMKRFVDRLQEIDRMLPLRTVPLKIFPFSPVKERRTPYQEEALRNQELAVANWRLEMERRFTPQERSLPIQETAYSKAP